MITGTLKKFEPTEKGITVMIECSHDDMHSIVPLYRRNVSVDVEQTEIPPTIESLDGIVMRLEELAGSLRKYINKGETDE